MSTCVCLKDLAKALVTGLEEIIPANPYDCVCVRHTALGVGVLNSGSHCKHY